MSIGTTFNRIPPVTKNLLIINVLIFIVMQFMPSRGAILDHYCALHYFTSPNFNVAQLVTYMFLHGGVAHLFFNMFALFMFGPNIEYAMGSKRFLFYYISCGIGAALVQLGVFAIMLSHYTSQLPADYVDHIIREGAGLIDRGYNYLGTEGTINALVNGATVGASGAIYGVLLAFGMIFPNMTLMLLIPPMPIKAKWLVIGYGALELVLGVSGTNDGVGHFCHLGGMIVGLLMILYWKHRGDIRRLY